MERIKVVVPLIMGDQIRAEPVLRISYDNGKTFGETIMLSNAIH